MFKNLRSTSSAGPENTFESSSPSSITGHSSVDEVIRTLSGSDVTKLLRYVRDWNANAKTSEVAQNILYAVMKLRSAEDVMRAFADEAGEVALASGATFEATARGHGAGSTALKELVDAIIPYTERHLARIEKLVQDSYVVDYILGEMDDGMFDGDIDEDLDRAGIMDVYART